MGDFLVELDQVPNVDIAVVFFKERIFPQLVSVVCMLASNNLSNNHNIIKKKVKPINE